MKAQSHITSVAQGVVLVNCGGSSASMGVTAHKMAAGTYTDQITGNTFTVSNGKISGNIGVGVAVVYNAKPAGPSASVNPGSKLQTDTLTLNLTIRMQQAVSIQLTAVHTQALLTARQSQSAQVLLAAQGQPNSQGFRRHNNFRPRDLYIHKVDPSLVQKVYFDNSSYNWSSAYAYIYVDSSTRNGAWPGVQMTRISTGYVIEVPEELSNGYVIRKAVVQLQTVILPTAKKVWLSTVKQ